MAISDIQTLISNDENRELELKKSTGELKDAMHSACAFLNTDGGWLIFGIAPTSLKMLGQEVTDTTRREIAQALAGIEPSVDVRVEYVDIPDQPGAQIIAMQFDAWVWGREPYTCNGRPFYKECQRIKMTQPKSGLKNGPKSGLKSGLKKPRLSSA